MAATTNMNHNGITVETSEPLPSLGGVGGQRGGVIGEVAAVKEGTQFNFPFTVRSEKDLTLIDETSTLYHSVKFLLEKAGVPIEVVVVEKAAKDADTIKNIIGGVDEIDGQLLGLEAFKACRDVPTNIGVASFCDVSLSNAVAGVCEKVYAEGWVNAPDTNTKQALDFGLQHGEAHKKVWSVDVRGERWDHPIPPAMYGMAARLSVKPWQTPNGSTLLLDDLARDVSYTVNDSGSEAVELNKKGVSLAVADPNGGIMFLGNRTLSGDFGNIIGIENQLIREIIKSHRDTMKYNLDLDFFKSRIAQLNNWGKTLKADDALIDFNVYLHPTRNTVDRYNNGEWVLVIDWAGYRPNEHSIVELNQVNHIVETFVGEIVKGI
tara:strand:+ start:1262 stop:2395 length:1134 start_codon:yes stop_codon:yes gene_type:complete